MFTRNGVFSSAGRSAVMATVAALALTAVEPTLALAFSPREGLSAAPAHGITDISSRARIHRRGYGGGGAAAAAAFAGIVGTGLAIAASQGRRDYYDSYDGYYGGGPVYYGGYGYHRNQSTVPYINEHGSW